MTTGKPVVVKQLPERMIRGCAQQFFREVEPQLKAERPYLVFDGSELSELDSAGVQMLLHCMEEVMKRNGELKLAAIPPGPALILELTRVDRLFETFENVRDAVESFYRLPLRVLAQSEADGYFSAVLEGKTNTADAKPTNIEIVA